MWTADYRSGLFLVDERRGVRDVPTVRTPDPEAFRAALRLLGKDPDVVAFLVDDLRRVAGK